MASNIDSVLTTAKKEILSSLASSLDIKFPDIKKKITNQTLSSYTFDSCLALYAPKFKYLYSDTLNATVLLAHLDFFSLYTILYVNIQNFNNLISVTKNKLKYLLSIYRDTNSTLKEKTIQKQNKYAIYTNFLNTKHIDMAAAKLFLGKNRLSESLNYNTVLTLPRSLSKEIYPLSINIRDIDNGENIIENTSDNKNIRYSINRLGFDKIGVVDSVSKIKTNNIYVKSPSVTGTIHGYYSDKIYIKVTSVSASGVYISGSSNNLDWSEAASINFNEDSLFNIDNELPIGLSINIPFVYGEDSIAINDGWKINLRYISLDDPEIISTIKFNTLSNLSYITFDDLTKSDIDLIDVRNKHKNLEDYIDVSEYNGSNNSYSDKMSHIVPMFKTVADLEMTMMQRDCSIDTVNSSFVHKFDFNISEIKGYYNEYGSYGICSFDKIEIPRDSGILSISTVTDKYIPRDEKYLTDYITTAGRFVKYFIDEKIMVSSGQDYLFIPYIENDGIITEYISPTITGNNTAIEFITSMPVTGGIRVLDLTAENEVYDFTEEEVIINNGRFIKLTMPIKTIDSGPGFNLKSVYVLTYQPVIYSYEESLNFYIHPDNSTKWMYNKNKTDSSIYYMYFKDINNKLNIAIATLGEIDNQTGEYKLVPFYGYVSGMIQMRSLAEASVSPIIFEYSLVCN